MILSQESDDHNVSSDKVQQQVSPQREIALSQGIDDVAKNEVSDSDAMACDLVSSHSSPPEQHSQSPKTPSHEFAPMQSGQDRPSIIRDKVTKDGYKWRKYGQKNVKGSEFKRSYYKCTYSDCPARKQFQLSHDGNYEDCSYIGQHNHPKPESNTVPPNTVPPVDRVLPVVEKGPPQSSFADVEGQENSSVEYESMPRQVTPLRFHPPSKVSRTDESKRLKKDNSNADATGADVLTGESRVIVRTTSESGIVNDGYRWRKYGQKMVKGNTNPRNYYRCSSPGCPVKKHVEKSSQNTTTVITTYEGQHDHAPPTGRGVLDNTATKLTPIRATILPNQGLESEIKEEEQQNEDPSTKEDSISDAMIRDSSLKVPCRLSEHDTPSTTSVAEPAQS